MFNAFGSRAKEFYQNKLAPNKLIPSSWSMILFFSTLAILVIYSSHQIDRKVFKISKLSEQLKDLRSKHIDMRTKLMSLSKPTKVAEDLKAMGLSEPTKAPFKIKFSE